MKDMLLEQIQVYRCIRNIGKSAVKHFTAPFIANECQVSLKVVEQCLMSAINSNQINKRYRVANPDDIGTYVVLDNLDDIKLNHKYQASVTGKPFKIGDEAHVEVFYEFSEPYLNELKRSDIADA